MSALQMQQKLEAEIPMTKNLGFKVLNLSVDLATCLLPLKPNINHKSTLFGGSQYSGCALACYSLFLFNVRSLNQVTNNIVVSKAEIFYKKPALDDVKIEASWSSAEEKEHFLESLKRKGKSRVSLIARVKSSEDLLLSEFRGDFVVLLE